MKAAHAKVDREAFYSVEDAIKILKDCAKERKFDETIEISMNLGIDPRHADQAVRGVTSLPHGTGAKVRVAVIAKDDKAEEAKKAGADIVGAEDLIETIQGGKIDFDRCIATPDMMALIGRVAKVLGPKGLMPNPKLGTVTPDVTKAVKAAKAGSIEYRAEKAGIVQAGVGKVSFDDKKLVTEASLTLLLCADVKAWDKDPARYWKNAPQEAQDILVPMVKPFYEDRAWQQRDEAMRSVGIVAQTLMLAAKAKGYDSCPMIGFDPDKAAEIINLPEDHVIGMMLVIGKAAKPAWSKPGQLPLGDVVVKDRF